MRFGEMLTAGVLLVAIGITLSIGADVTNTISGSFSAGSIAKLAVDNATAGIGNLAKWLPTIGTVLAAAVIIALIMGAFLSIRGKGE